jgi:putative transposase
LQHQHRIVSSLRDFLRGVRHGHAALEEQLFEVAQAQLEAEIPTHCATDNASRKTVPRKIVTDQLRSYQAAKTEIPELASVKHVFVKAAARLNKGLKTVTGPRVNASGACVAFATLNALRNFSPALGRQHFALKRHLLRASLYRKQLATHFAAWREFTGCAQNPSTAL